MKFANQKIDNPLATSAIYGAFIGHGGTVSFRNTLTLAKFGLNYRF